MTFPLRPFAITLLAIAFSTPTEAQNPLQNGSGKTEGWKGLYVFTKWAPTNVKFWDTVNDERKEYELKSTSFDVIREENGKLRLSDNGKEGWASKDDFVLASEVIPYFSGRIDANPKDSHAYYCRGRVEMMLNQVDEAIKDFTSFIKLEPNLPVGHAMRCSLWQRKGELEKAIADADEVVRLIPDQSFPLVTRSELRKAKKDYRGAIEDYDTAIKMKPDDLGLYFGRSIIHEAARAFEKQIADCDKVIELMPTHFLAFAKRGQARANILDIRGGMQDVKDSLRLQPKSGWSQYLRACLYFVNLETGSGDAFETIRDEKDAIGGYANFAAIYCYLAAVQDGKPKVAEQALKSAVEKVKKDWPLPIVQYLSGDVEEAIVLKAAKTDGQFTEAHCVIGIQLMLNGEHNAAKKHLLWVKEKGDPSYADFTIAIGMLARMEKAAPKVK